MLVLIPCNEPHRHTEIDFRDWYKNRGVCLTDNLVNSEKSFIMSYQTISKNGCQFIAYSNQSIPWDISRNNVFNLLVAGKDVLAICAVPGLEQGIAYEIDAFMMTFKEQGTFLHYLKPTLNNHRFLFVKRLPAPSFVALGKPFSDKSDSFPAAGQR